ncbi:MAG: hypothetical protein PUH44_01075, partial [Bacteroidales bacterium]|nr:hypothetical protein [Bacteroidales bacterium]MDY2705209.1 hypothetical protein [Alloprevotella sp.]
FRLFEHGFFGFCGCSLKGNVPHVALNVWLSGNATLKGDFSFFLNTDFADFADAHREGNVPHVARSTCGSAEMQQESLSPFA